MFVDDIIQSLLLLYICMYGAILFQILTTTTRGERRAEGEGEGEDRMSDEKGTDG